MSFEGHSNNLDSNVVSNGINFQYNGNISKNTTIYKDLDRFLFEFPAGFVKDFNI